MLQQTSDFSKGTVSKNILQLAVPMIFAQLVNVLYSVVDRMYIGHLPEVSAAALTGIGLTFPFISIVTAFANLFGTRWRTFVFHRARRRQLQARLSCHGQYICPIDHNRHPVDGSWLLAKAPQRSIYLAPATLPFPTPMIILPSICAAAFLSCLVLA